MSGHQVRWTVQKIAQRLGLIATWVYRQRVQLPPFRYQSLENIGETPPPIAPENSDTDWQIFTPPHPWPALNQHFVLRTDFQVPPDWKPQNGPVVLIVSLGQYGSFCHPEALAYLDGKPYATCDRFHHEIGLPAAYCDGQPHLLALHGWTGDVIDAPLPVLQTACLAQVYQPGRDFLVTARVALGVAQALPEEDRTRHALLNALNHAFRLLDTRAPGEGFYQSIPNAHQILREGIQKAGAPLDVDLYASGHAHIDVAWLWTLAETRHKIQRTAYNTLRLMEQFPTYHFAQSQPQLYEFVRQDAPDLFQDIQQRVKSGQWEPLGGMWVEADCNISGGESLARQFLLGRRFYRQHFGPNADSPVLWLPDVFGYAWNLPQLIQQAGLHYFFTVKIGWNQYNRLPYDTFWWQGLDGTRVLTHFSPTPEPDSPYASTYNADATPQAVLGTYQRFKQKELLDAPVLMAYGHGDGGGGPTRAMIENLNEMSHFPATPRVHTGRVIDFFERLKAISANCALPVWDGELYLEYHRGTYTTQSRNKRFNRKCEFLLHDVEFLATLAAQLAPTYPYPADELNQAWQLVCLNQFHDILPGSSIHDVYVQSGQQYEQVAAIAAGIRQQALEHIAAQLGGDLLLVNPTPFPQSQPVFWSGDLPQGNTLCGPSGNVLLTQKGDGGIWIDAGELPAYSITPLQISAGGQTETAATLSAAPDHLENAHLRVELDAGGDIIRIYDKTARREVLPAHTIANQFQAFEDRPLNWDAWDVDIFYDDKKWAADPAAEIAVVENGPLTAALRIKRRIHGSDYTQTVRLMHNSPALTFSTRIHWQQQHTLLKVAFPVDILAPQATYEIQWGNVQRPTHRNTSWDWARFETCAQKWADLSEGNYGVSLLNDCKYGYDIHENVMRLSLLRSPTYPDPTADQGEHEFTYCLLPHTGTWQAGTIPQAYVLNDPCFVCAPHQRRPLNRQLAGLIQSTASNLVIETIKRAEDGNGWIVRLYESHRCRGTTTIKAPFPIQAAWQTNLLEENERSLTVSGQCFDLDYRPYQIITLRLQFT